MFCCISSASTTATDDHPDAPASASSTPKPRAPGLQSRSSPADLRLLSETEKIARMRNDLLKAKDVHPRWMATSDALSREQQAYIKTEWKALQKQNPL